ncbi:hypothetical protein [Bacillus sp. JJ1474]|uniref:hypothetical protein n=1 Tax=Bacillus sp. JJ1474 TaxID=3122955 RepID=UPI002FFDE2D5
MADNQPELADKLLKLATNSPYWLINLNLAFEMIQTHLKSAILPHFLRFEHTHFNK